MFFFCCCFCLQNLQFFFCPFPANFRFQVGAFPFICVACLIIIFKLTTVLFFFFNLFYFLIVFLLRLNFLILIPFVLFFFVCIFRLRYIFKMALAVSLRRALLMLLTATIFVIMVLYWNQGAIKPQSYINTYEKSASNQEQLNEFPM